ncbi:LrgB family protein [Paenibacillus sp. 1001270B_150601_E10]|uniref:LrgB family protein n=1 Tax=Paenibacillus sp. 1001270B_150601_E10 TaxID=2787079 RepID=UPI0018A0C992|nr:LrgB family protein [Paenibacillus sp. 1001270B_150601_E10]
MNVNIPQLAFGFVVTVLVYFAARALHRKVKWLHPIIVCAGTIISMLMISGIPLDDYKAGADLLSMFLGPATIALGVPIYKHRHHIKENFKAVMLSITCGSIVGVGSVAAIMFSFSGVRDIAMSMLPKSVSSPIAVEIAKSLGAIPELAAVFTVFTGLVGAIAGTAFLRRVGIKDEVSLGLALGTAAHGFGTAKCLTDSEKQGSFSGLAMGLMGVITSILFAILFLFM